MSQKTNKTGIKQEKRRDFLKLGAAGVVAGGMVSSGVLQASAKTPSQPLGPFFPREQSPIIETVELKDGSPLYLSNDSDLTQLKGSKEKAIGEEIYIKGIVTDSEGEALKDALIVIWQASHEGRYNHQGDSRNVEFKHPNTGQSIERKLDKDFQYWGQALTNEKGEYVFKTILPGFYPADLSSKWYRPPHIHFLVAPKGKQEFVTQMYFDVPSLDQNSFIQELNDKDLILKDVLSGNSLREDIVVKFEKTKITYGEEALIGQFDIQL